jgi:AhpD family alkylhydroperoxidase
MRPAPKCVIDRSRPCGACIAPGPQQCPYAYLLDPAELAAVASAGTNRHPAFRKGSNVMSHGKVVRDDLRGPTRELRRAIPDVYEGYRALHDAALAAGALDAKTKELIALAIAVSKECDGCIAAHAHAAVRQGATPAEAAEAIGVTFLMNGGPATVYGARAFDAVREFYEQRQRQDTAA